MSEGAVCVLWEKIIFPNLSGTWGGMNATDEFCFV